MKLVAVWCVEEKYGMRKDLGLAWWNISYSTKITTLHSLHFIHKKMEARQRDGEWGFGGNIRDGAKGNLPKY